MKDILPFSPLWHQLVRWLIPVVVICSLCCCGTTSINQSGKIVAVGAESEYANVIQQIGGQYVSVTAILSNPNTDPHTFESSPQVATTVSGASLIVQNGLGYDVFMNDIEAASPNPNRKVIVAQTILGLPNSTPNPHLWYKPTTMPAVARAIANDLAALQPAHAAYFHNHATTFITSLRAWTTAIAHLKAQYPNAPFATTEPVGDYMLQAAGLEDMTPWTLQADIMNGVDPSPQVVAVENALFHEHKVKVFVYNTQVVDALTQALLTTAKENHIPVVGVYETMPTPGYTYQTWMIAEVHAVENAIGKHQSTGKL